MYRLGGGEPGGADGHCLTRRERSGQSYDPLGRNSGVLRVGAVARSTDVVAMREHRIADGEVGRGRRNDLTGEVDSWDERADASDAASGQGRECVLVVHGRVLNPDDDLAGGQFDGVERADLSHDGRLFTVVVEYLRGNERGEALRRLSHLGSLSHQRLEKLPGPLLLV